MPYHSAPPLAPTIHGTRHLVRLAAIGLLAAVAAHAPVARAEVLEGLMAVLADKDNSPVPMGWSVGLAGYTGASPYAAGSALSLPIPGAIYLSERFMFLGDRAFYTFAKQGDLSFYGRVRVRLGNLNPDDHPEWAGLQERKAELEAGLGAVLVSPLGMWTARTASDISGRSKGHEVLLNWAAPLVGDRWMLMPGISAIWRSGALANYYFGGVSASEATPSRPAYDVGSTWSINPSLVASYRLSPQWIAGAVLSYDAFGDAISNSPLVQKQGRHDVLLAIGYVWR